MGPSDNHRTQINILILTEAKSPSKVTEHTVLYDSVGLTFKTDALSKKRAGSPVGVLNATTEKGKVLSKAARFGISDPL